MVLRTRVGPDGSIISDGDESSSNGGGGSGGGGRRRLCPTSVDTFGFHLELKHFAIVLLFVSVTMGPIGTILFLSFLSIYTFYQRRSNNGSTGGDQTDGKTEKRPEQISKEWVTFRNPRVDEDPACVKRLHAFNK